jgi:hypothetical protein
MHARAIGSPTQTPSFVAQLAHARRTGTVAAFEFGDGCGAITRFGHAAVVNAAPDLETPRVFAVKGEEIPAERERIKKDCEKKLNDLDKEEAGISPTFDTGRVLEKVREHRAQIS